jgi:hypothetical protein
MLAVADVCDRVETWRCDFARAENRKFAGVLEGGAGLISLVRDFRSVMSDCGSIRSTTVRTESLGVQRGHDA